MVRLLSCSSLALIPTATINIGKDLVRDICFVQQSDKELLVVNRNLDSVCEIQAYNTATSTLEWRIRGRLPGMGTDVDPLGITTDGRGHLFVCDGANRCIFVVSADGKFVGILLLEGEQNLGEPRKIRWCDTVESLVVSNKRDEKWNVSILNVKRNGWRAVVKYESCLQRVKWKHEKNKKVLLREHKRHTDRRVASTPSVVLMGGGTPSQDQTGGYPHHWMGEGYPIQSWTGWGGIPISGRIPGRMGVPPEGWIGVPLPPPKTRWGTPSPHPGMGITPTPGLAGVPPWTWTLLGSPPPPSVDWHTKWNYYLPSSLFFKQYCQ